jgi:phage baseplate assembly protein W
MAFGAIKKFPNDTRPRVGIGVNIPFSDGGVFTSNYQTKDAIKNNIVNFFLTNPGERPDNPSFGGGLRRFVFEQLSDDNIDLIEEDLTTKLSEQFPDVVVGQVQINSLPDENTLQISLTYQVVNTGIEDALTFNFA